MTMTRKKDIHRAPISFMDRSTLGNKQKPDLPKVPISIFNIVSGIKKDQLAGFVRYAKLNGFVLLTIPQWQEEYERFLCKPVRS
jgi:hypothetical protein